MTLISQCDSIVFAVAQRRLESESLCNSEDLVYSIFGWNNSKELNFHNEKSSWHDTECVIRFYLLSRLRDCTTKKSNLVSFENDEIKWKSSWQCRKDVVRYISLSQKAIRNKAWKQKVSYWCESRKSKRFPRFYFLKDFKK